MKEGGTAPSATAVIRAPIEDTVVEKLVTPGQLIQAGTTPAFTIADPVLRSYERGRHGAVCHRRDPCTHRRHRRREARHAGPAHSGGHDARVHYRRPSSAEL